MANAPNNNDDGMAPFYVVSIILLMLLLFYWLFHNQIIRVVFLIKRLELMIIMSWDTRYMMLMNWCNHVLESTVTLKQLKYLAYNISDAFKPLFWIVGTGLIGILFFFHPSRKYRQTFSMQSLSRFIGKHFKKVCLPNDLQGNVDSAFDIALTPVQYLQKYKLIENKQLDIHALHNNLSQQLGSRWLGTKQMAIEIYGLFVAFSLCICDKRKQADKLFGYLNAEFTNNSNSFKKYINTRKLNQFINAHLTECISHSDIQAIISQHHYTYTLICALLHTARKSGIVPSASFLWLKKVNRTLWYALNNVGRKTFFSEGAAITAHWKFEEAIKTPMSSPMVQNVINALQHEYQLYELLNHDKI
ncbi:hypothetical protein [Fastidiosibacter lacustris]|uniref:secretion/conjugation apparatus DotM-related subunit n=1 Tax=Fastidiosibacter lacustris TaxID=2056695 RepID=UPI000E34F683|nr:hypothetical protein [Fastidiosibacter lacustris]